MELVYFVYNELAQYQRQESRYGKGHCFAGVIGKLYPNHGVHKPGTGALAFGNAGIAAFHLTKKYLTDTLQRDMFKDS